MPRQIKARNVAGASLTKARFNNKGKGRQPKRFAPGNLSDPQMLDQLRRELNDAVPDSSSRTHESSLDELMARATLDSIKAERGAETSKLIESTQIVVRRTAAHNATQDEIARYDQLLTIPRRLPKEAWPEDPSLLKELEETKFNNWRRQLADIEQTDGIIVTPYERNIELWRQFWRCVERSHIVLNIIDARNPLLYRCKDIEIFANEENADVILLLNKSDMLTEQQRQKWADYFNKLGTTVWFFSAIQDDVPDDADVEKDEESNDSEEYEDDLTLNDATLLSRDELIERLHAEIEVIAERDEIVGPLTVGLVGYPNVGKSSTINKLMQSKKVPVSATPGKTRHIQTLRLDDMITLCDCPGLVFPSLAPGGRASMVLYGVLPSSQMLGGAIQTDVIMHLLQIVDPSLLQNTYAVQILDEDGQLKTSVDDTLALIAYSRGFMSPGGIPDRSRAARKLVNDAQLGRLNLALAPPGVDQADYDKLGNAIASLSNDELMRRQNAAQSMLDQVHRKKLLIDDQRSNEHQFDEDFFKPKPICAMIKGKGARQDNKKHHKGKKLKTRVEFKCREN